MLFRSDSGGHWGLVVRRVSEVAVRESGASTAPEVARRRAQKALLEHVGAPWGPAQARLLAWAEQEEAYRRAHREAVAEAVAAGEPAPDWPERANA